MSKKINNTKTKKKFRIEISEAYDYFEPLNFQLFPRLTLQRLFLIILFLQKKKYFRDKI